MRIEQIIAAVTRLVINQVREIRGVEMSVASCLTSLWQTRMHLGLSRYSISDLTSSLLSDTSLTTDDAGNGNSQPGIKRGNLLCQFRLAAAFVAEPATCPAGTSAA